MAKYIKTDPTQMRLMPLSLNDLVPEDHLARRIKSIVGQIDLVSFDASYKNDESGRPAIPPCNLLSVLIYAYATGVHSSRVIEEKCKQDLTYMFLAEFLTPDHGTIVRFRVIHKKALEHIFAQTVALGLESKLITLTELALDGTKIKSAGSRRQFVDTDKIEVTYEKCKKIIKKILDTPEEGESSTQKQASRKLRKLEKKLSNLETAREQLDKYLLKPNRIHLTENDTRLMKDHGVYGAMYNAQTVVDGESQMIVDQYLTQNANDKKEGPLAFDRIAKSYGPALAGTKLLADNGYLTNEFIEKDNNYGIDLLISLGDESNSVNGKVGDQRKWMTYNENTDTYKCKNGKNLPFIRIAKYKERDGSIGLYRLYQTSECSDCPFKKECFHKGAKKMQTRTLMDKATDPEVAKRRQDYRNKMKSQVNHKAYQRRNAIVEPVFALITSHKKGGRFMVWGLQHAQSEWTLHCIVHNVLKLGNGHETRELKAA